jgi:hypothetical protein
MKTIHKYELKPVPGIQHIEVRKDATFLKAANQYDTIAMWYEVDTHEAW